MIRVKKILLGVLIISLLLSGLACKKQGEVNSSDPESTTVSIDPAKTEQPTATSGQSAVETKLNPDRSGQKLYPKAGILISDFLAAVKKQDIKAISDFLPPDLAEKFVKLSVFEAEPSIHEITWESGFVELLVNKADGQGKLRIDQPNYLSFVLQNLNGEWGIVGFDLSQDLFSADSKMTFVEEKAGEEWKINDLSGLPGAYSGYENTADLHFFLNNNQRLLTYERRDQAAGIAIKLGFLEVNGFIVPSEVSYSKDGEVQIIKELTKDFGWYIYGNGENKLVDRFFAVVK